MKRLPFFAKNCNEEEESQEENGPCKSVCNDLDSDISEETGSELSASILGTKQKA